MKNHKTLGHLSVHHLIPKKRLRDYYGLFFCLPNNKLRLWRVKHNAWHKLFKNRTINEIIKHLRNRNHLIWGYKKKYWRILFGNKNKTKARKLLVRMRNMIRKKYSYFELDKKFREKAYLMTQNYGQVVYTRRLLNYQFQDNMCRQKYLQLLREYKNLRL